MTFEEWWDHIYTPPKYSPLDKFEMEKAWEEGYNQALADVVRHNAEGGEVKNDF